MSPLKGVSRRWLVVLALVMSGTSASGPVFAGGLFGHIGIDVTKSLAKVTQTVTATDLAAQRSKIEEVVGQYSAIPVTISPVTSPASNTANSVSVTDLVKSNCPGASQDYLANASGQIATLNPNVNVTTDGREDTLSFADGGTGQVYIPYCLGATAKSYTFEPGDTLWQVYGKQQSTGIADWTQYQAAVKAMNTPGLNIMNVAPGTSIYLPSTTFDVVVPASQSSAAAAAIESATGAQVVLKSSNSGTPQFASADEDLINERGGDAVPAADEAASIEHAEGTLADVSRALAVDVTAMDKAHLKYRADPVVAAVVDTGIEGGDLPEAAHFGRAISDQIHKLDMEAVPAYPRAFHGTGVTSVAAGGHLMALLSPMVSLMDIAPYSALSTVVCDRSAPSPDNCEYDLSPDRVEFALGEAGRDASDVTLANISLAFPDELSPNFREANIGPGKKLLIAVAAGNESTQLDESHLSYPASYGGADASNLLTVAALNLDGTMLKESNFGPSHVDIAAWGQDVPVMEYDPPTDRFDVKFRSGTSYASPQMIFAAAMILRSTWQQSRPAPAVLKMRLLASADIVPALMSKVADGRVLDIATAISAHTDVVKFEKDGKPQVLQGHVLMDGMPPDPLTPDSATEVALCPDVSFGRDQLMKIAFTGPVLDDGDSFLIYAESRAARPDDRKILRKTCPAIPGTIAIEDILSGKIIPLDSSTIRDITFASDPYWED